MRARVLLWAAVCDWRQLLLGREPERPHLWPDSRRLCPQCRLCIESLGTRAWHGPRGAALVDLRGPRERRGGLTHHRPRLAGPAPSVPYFFSHRRQGEPTPETYTTSTIRCHVNLKKSSLKLVRHATPEGDRYHLTFLVDADKPCRVAVYVMASEHQDGNGNI